LLRWWADSRWAADVVRAAAEDDDDGDEEVDYDGNCSDGLAYSGWAANVACYSRFLHRSTVWSGTVIVSFRIPLCLASNLSLSFSLSHIPFGLPTVHH
jgi:hypothetical protein